jgi:hypothetical protein
VRPYHYRPLSIAYHSSIPLVSTACGAQACSCSSLPEMDTRLVGGAMPSVLAGMTQASTGSSLSSMDGHVYPSPYTSRTRLHKVERVATSAMVMLGCRQSWADIGELVRDDGFQWWQIGRHSLSIVWSCCCKSISGSSLNLFLIFGF